MPLSFILWLTKIRYIGITAILTKVNLQIQCKNSARFQYQTSELEKETNSGIYKEPQRIINSQSNPRY